MVVDNRQEIRPLACSFALLIASTRTLIAHGKIAKNASDQLQISLYTFFLPELASCQQRHQNDGARAAGVAQHRMVLSVFRSYGRFDLLWPPKVSPYCICAPLAGQFAGRKR